MPCKALSGLLSAGTSWSSQACYSQSLCSHLQEPTKQDLLCYEKDQTLSLPRTALALVQLPTGSIVYEATVDLSDQPLLIGWDKVRHEVLSNNQRGMRW